MQVRHIENAQLDLAKAEKAELELPPAIHDDRPWEEIVGYLALLAAIHMQPCQAATERKEDERETQRDKDEPEEA